MLAIKLRHARDRHDIDRSREHYGFSAIPVATELPQWQAYDAAMLDGIPEMTSDRILRQPRNGPTQSREAMAQRTASILGDGPRLAPLNIDSTSAELEAILTRMAKVNMAIDSREKEAVTQFLANAESSTANVDILVDPEALSEIVRTMLRHADLFVAQTDVGIQLLGRGALAPRDRELAILRIGWLCQAPYEWGEHVMVATKVGVSSADIERTTFGSEADGWSDHDRAILQATEELYEDAMISDATWAALAARLDDKQLIELPVLVGQYQTVAYYQNSLRLRLHRGNIGLAAR